MELNHVSQRGRARTQDPGWQFEDRRRAPENSSRSEWTQGVSDTDHLPLSIQNHNINGKPHSPGVDALRWQDQQAIPKPQFMLAQ